MVKAVLVFDVGEVFGRQYEQAVLSLLDGSRGVEDVAFNVLGLDRPGMNSWLAEPFYQALRGSKSARIEIEAPQPAPAPAQPQAPAQAKR